MKKVTELVRELALPAVEEQGCTLWDVEYVREAGQWYLRVYIDKDGGVNILDCEAISRKVSDLLDEADPIEQAYYLSVSSLGIDRPLKKDADYERNLGKELEVKLYAPLKTDAKGKGKKELTGVLESYDGESFTLRAGENSIRLLRRDAALVRPYIRF